METVRLSARQRRASADGWHGRARFDSDDDASTIWIGVNNTHWWRWLAMAFGIGLGFLFFTDNSALISIVIGVSTAALTWGFSKLFDVDPRTGRITRRRSGRGK